MKAFELEDTFPDAFLFQGLVGGALGGFLWIVISGFSQAVGYLPWIIFLSFLVARLRVQTGEVIPQKHRLELAGCYGGRK
jgi:hypothetical protein